MRRTCIVLILAIILILLTLCKNRYIVREDTHPDNFIDKKYNTESFIENDIINQIFPTLIDTLEIKNLSNFNNEIQKTNTIYYFDLLLEPRYDKDRLKNLCINQNIYVGSLNIRLGKLRFKIHDSQIKGKTLLCLSSFADIDSMRFRTNNRYILIAFTNFAFNDDFTIGGFIFDLGYSLRIGSEFFVIFNKQGNKWKILRVIGTSFT